jgi:hypothetical protein
MLFIVSDKKVSMGQSIMRMAHWMQEASQISMAQ